MHQLETILSAWRQCVLLAPLFFSGCSNLTAEQRQWLKEAQTAYEDKQYSRSIEYSSRFLEQVLDEPETVRALYYKGLSEAYSGQREQAYTDLGHAVTMEGQPRLKWRAHAALGSLFFENENWESAAENFALAAANMPKAPPRDLVLYRAGLAHERAGDWPAAQAAYEQLIAEFPGSNPAESAQRRLSTRGETFAVKCGEFAVPQNADNFLFDLQRQGLAPYIFRDKRGPKTVYVVLVGRYQREDEAESAAARLRESIPAAEVWP